MDTYESREDGISRAAQELGDDVASFVERRLRPAVGIEFLGDDAEAGPATEGRTRFGGLPDLADDETWPVYDGPGLFVGQIDFAEIPEQARESLREYLGRDIPAEGLLRIFAPSEEDSESYFWADPCFIQALFTTAGVRQAELPEEYDAELLVEAVPARLVPAWDLPLDDYQAEDWPWQTWEESEPYLEFRASLHGANYLFGYPDHTSLAYDPTPEDTIPLLTLFSEEDFEWLWADGDFLQVFVKPEALAAGEFGELLSNAG